MSKAILEFNLPEDQNEYYFASHGMDYWDVLWGINQFLRNELKYNDSISNERYEVYEEIREKIYGLLEEKSLLMDV